MRRPVRSALREPFLFAQLALQIFHFPAQLFFRASRRGDFFGLIWLGISHQMLKYGFVEFHSESIESFRSSSSRLRS